MTEKCTEYYSYMTSTRRLNKNNKYQYINLYLPPLIYPLLREKTHFYSSNTAH